MKSLNSMIANHLLYLTKLLNSRYPEHHTRSSNRPCDPSAAPSALRLYASCPCRREQCCWWLSSGLLLRGIAGSPLPAAPFVSTDRTSEQSFSCLSTPRDSGQAEALPSHSRLGVAPYAVRRPSTKPLPLRSSVPLSVVTPGRRGRNLRRLSIGYASGASP
jgi:hypothetical protein